jgi:hypothetical protein
MAPSKHTLPALFSVLLVVVSFPLSFSYAEEVNQIQAEGVAVVLQGNLAIARDAAIEDALRKSVEQAVGTMIDSQTLVENFQLVSDRIYAQSHGYIKGYRIVKEEKADSLFRVRVEASVAAGHLKDDLSALRILLTRVHKPRMMVLLEERNLGAHDPIQPWSDLSQVESVIVQKFLEKGFHFVDEAQVKRNISRDQVLLLIEGDERGAKALASEYGAEVIILGKAAARSTPLKELKALNLSGMKSYQAQVTIKAFRVDTGETLANATESAAAVHIDEMTAGNEALKKVGEKVAPLLIDQIIQHWGKEVGGTALIQLLISGLTFRELTKFKEILKGEIRGVKDLHQRSFEANVARIDVDLVGDAQNLADELSLRDFGTFRVEIIGFASRKIDLRVIQR